MKKALFIVFLAFVLNVSAVYAQEKVIEGSVTYTVETAKNAAFSGMDLKIDKSILTPFIKDENNKENRDALKSGVQPIGRNVMFFEANQGAMIIRGYAVVYKETPEYVYYYSTSGYLVAFDIDKKTSDNPYPYKIGKYNPLTGNLVSVALYVSEDEQYVYLKSGKLKAHWKGDVAYNAKGKPIATRGFSAP